MLKIKYVILFCLMSTLVNADPTCVVKGGGAFDNLLLQFGNAAHAWQASIEPLAKKFFYILFGTEFMWQLTVKKVFAGDIEKLWVFFFTRTVLCFFFGQYLVNIEMYSGIINFLSNLGSQIGGFSLNIQPGSSGLNTIGPSAVVSSFSCVADMIHTVTDQTGAFEYITVKITLAIMQVILFLVLILIAFYIIQIILQAYLMIYAGFLFAGFAGSSWTMSYWDRYLGTIISIGAKFLVVCLLMGVLNVQMQSWTNDINQAIISSNIAILSSVICRVVAMSIMVALAIWRLPDWFAASITGQIADMFMTKPSYMNATNQLSIGQPRSTASHNRPGGMINSILKNNSLEKVNSNTNINPFTDTER